MCVDQNRSTPKNALTTKGTNLAGLSLPQFKFMPSNKDAILTHGWLVTESNPEKDVRHWGSSSHVYPFLYG